MKNIVEKIETWLTPIAEKLSKIAFIKAISETMQILLPIFIVGSFGCLLAFAGIPVWSNFLAEVPVLQTIFMNMQSWTMSIISLYVIIVLPYRYAEDLGMDCGISCSIISVVAFLNLTPMATYGPIDNTWLGHAGMISAMIITVGVVRLIKLLIDKKITIKMPAGVPLIVSDSFATLIPGAVTITVSAVLGQVFAATSYGSIHNLIYTLIQTPLQKIGLSYGGLLAYDMIATLSMYVGIHGTSTTTWFSPLLQNASAVNLEAYQAGQEAVYVVDKAMSDMTKIGGIGSTIGLVAVILIVCKSKRLKEVAKVAAVPQLFNINEPVLFGLPVLLNPVMFIPYVFGQFFNTTAVYIAVATGFIGHSNGAQVGWCLPPYIGTLLTNQTPVKAVLFQLALTVVDMLIWYPFVKMADKKYLEEEKATEAE